jgi:hypothetical protein
VPISTQENIFPALQTSGLSRLPHPAIIPSVEAVVSSILSRDDRAVAVISGPCAVWRTEGGDCGAIRTNRRLSDEGASPQDDPPGPSDASSEADVAFSQTIPTIRHPRSRTPGSSDVRRLGMQRARDTQKFSLSERSEFGEFRRETGASSRRSGKLATRTQ